MDRIELAFRKFDLNHDGFLSRDEFDQVPIIYYSTNQKLAWPNRFWGPFLKGIEAIKYNYKLGATHCLVTVCCGNLVKKRTLLRKPRVDSRLRERLPIVPFHNFARLSGSIPVGVY